MTPADELRTAEERLRRGDPRVDSVLGTLFAALLYACAVDRESRPEDHRSTYLDTAALAVARAINARP